MRVTINQTRQDHLARQIGRLSLRAFAGEDFGVRPGLHDALATDGDGFANREAAIDRNDLAVMQNEVRRRRLGP